MAQLMQIWEDSSSFRGELKKCAREVVRLLYNLFPDGENEYTPKEYIQHIKEAIENLLRNGNFMRNGTDDEVSITMTSDDTISSIHYVIGPYEQPHPSRYR